MFSRMLVGVMLVMLDIRRKENTPARSLGTLLMLRFVSIIKMVKRNWMNSSTKYPESTSCNLDLLKFQKFSPLKQRLKDIKL